MKKKSDETLFEVINESPIWGLAISGPVVVIGIAIFFFKVSVVIVGVLLFLMLTAKPGN